MARFRITLHGSHQLPLNFLILWMPSFPETPFKTLTGACPVEHLLAWVFMLLGDHAGEGLHPWVQLPRRRQSTCARIRRYWHGASLPCAQDAFPRKGCKTKCERVAVASCIT